MTNYEAKLLIVGMAAACTITAGLTFLTPSSYTVWRAEECRAITRMLGTTMNQCFEDMDRVYQHRKPEYLR